MNRNKILSTINTLYTEVFNQGKFDLFKDLVAGEYIQHNPFFPNGIEPIVGYIKQTGRIPCEIKRMAIDGDLAFIHVHYMNWAGKEYATVDIFRFDVNGKIVEHWDVLQQVPEKSENNNTMF